MIFGNIMSGFLLDKGNQFLYFITISGIAILAAMMFLCLCKPKRFDRKVLIDGELKLIKGDQLEKVEKEASE